MPAARWGEVVVHLDGLEPIKRADPARRCSLKCGLHNENSAKWCVLTRQGQAQRLRRQNKGGFKVRRAIERAGRIGTLANPAPGELILVLGPLLGGAEVKSTD